jgi:oligopeptide/dipeptide ABC transporter, ATP-binding protein, C-terminal domain
MGYLFISHNLSVVYQIADNIAVMYLGRIVEYGKAHRIFKNPLHPYTRALFSAIPVPDVRMRGKRERIELKGHVPSLIDPPDRCRFYDRCYEKDGEVCSNKIPELVEAEPDHMVACFRRAG